MQVYYASGYHRRLDSAVRQNIIDATRQIAQNGANIMGEILEYDAVEITAHMNPAPDHEPVQGRVFLRAQYERMQAGQDFTDVDGVHYAGFRRPISEWNCRHIAAPFSTKFSKRLYTPEQLADMAAKNAKGCEIDGKYYTLYQADQMMRKIETEVRRWKDAANAARINGNDMEERRNCQRKINALAARYKKISDASGLPQRKERMSVEGFRMVKIETSDAPVLKNAVGHVIIPVKKTDIKAVPNSITQVINAKGGIDRNYYGPDGMQIKQVSNNDHGKPAKHPYGKKYSGPLVKTKEGKFIVNKQA